MCKRITSHYSDVIMRAMASQTTGVSIVCLSVCSDADPRKHQSSASLAFVRGIHRHHEFLGCIQHRRVNDMVLSSDFSKKFIVMITDMYKRTMKMPTSGILMNCARRKFFLLLETFVCYLSWHSFKYISEISHTTAGSAVVFHWRNLKKNPLESLALTLISESWKNSDVIHVCW